METAHIREIRPEDNTQVALVIREVLIELGVPKIGTAYADKALERMYENYNVPKATYFVVEDDDGSLLGCAGIAQLENHHGNVCELQKMYLLKKSRGRGLGAKLMRRCIEKAKEFNYGQCYLETMPYMENAQRLYTKMGFGYIEAPMGDTGHFSCPVWMLKAL